MRDIDKDEFKLLPWYVSGHIDYKGDDICYGS